jgi:hypothetical protein
VTEVLFLENLNINHAVSNQIHATKPYPDAPNVKPPPATREAWRIRRKTYRECTFHERHSLAHCHKMGKKERFEIALEPEAPGICSNEHFITDIAALKSSLYRIPTHPCRD